MSFVPPISFRLSPLLGLAKGFFKRGLLVFLGYAASFPVVLGEFGCDVNCQAISLIARTDLGTRLVVMQSCAVGLFWETNFDPVSHTELFDTNRPSLTFNLKMADERHRNWHWHAPFKIDGGLVDPCTGQQWDQIEESKGEAHSQRQPTAYSGFLAGGWHAYVGESKSKWNFQKGHYIKWIMFLTTFAKSL